MNAEEIERRRHRRVELGVPISIRRIQSRESQASSFEEGMTQNISLAGVACTMPTPAPLAVGEMVIISIAIPYESRREFPFARLAGRGRVVRLKASTPSPDLAIEFAEDLTVLTATPERL